MIKNSKAMTKVPEWWKETTLGEVSEIKGGKRLPKGDILVSYKTQHPYIRITDFENHKIKKDQLQYVSDEVYKSISRYIVNTWDVILSIVGSIGLVAYIDEYLNKANLTENCVKIIRLRSVNPLFLYYFLISNLGQNEINKNTVWAVQKKLPIYGVQNIKLTLPPLPEQQAIAKVLSSFDDKIELLREENQTLEQMGQELFKEWFGKWKVDDDLPEGRRVGKIEDIFHFLEWPWIRNWQYTDSWTKFINIKLIQNQDILTNNANFVSNEEAYWRYKHFLLEERDFVLSTSWTLGRSAIIRRKHLPLMLNTSVIRFRPLDKKSYWFMYLYLSSRAFIHQLESMASWSVQLNFWPMHLKQIDLIIPDNLIIDQFCKITNNLFEKITKNLDQIDELSATRDQLLPKLMSGEVRVEF
jgi:type I restriction enzyme S subunit